jgi:uridine phosphorylase
MSQFPETELILTKENRVYHINLKAEDIADDVIVVGDQHRVAQISKFFSKIEFKTEHREFVTHRVFLMENVLRFYQLVLVRIISTS